MAVKSNLSSGLIAVGNTDTTVLENAGTGRWVVYSINLHDYGATGEDVELFVSADATSAAGERIDIITIGADETKPGIFTPVALDIGQFLIAKGSAGSTTNIEAVYTAYSGSS